MWVTTDYEKYAKDLLYQLKFNRAGAAAPIIAEYMAEALPHLPTDTLVTYVPTATSRRRLRGYDQAELIAKDFARLRQLPFLALLARSGQTRQVGSNRKQRQHQLAASFRSVKDQKLAKASILVIDDIVTTGATLEAAAQVLSRSGASKIYAAVFAQKQ